MLMTALEFWAFEIITVIAGIVGETELGASVILFNILAFVYMIPLGF